MANALDRLKQELEAVEAAATAKIEYIRSHADAAGKWIAADAEACLQRVRAERQTILNWIKQEAERHIKQRPVTNSPAAQANTNG